ncbi:MAG: TPM domain-containing protein, partial [Acidobacteriota bacterium]|nr:TPM domain-containing protein [Acidobacteriota bacterium]
GSNPRNSRARVPEGTTMEELSSRALRDWGVGQKGRSNGVIFFVFPTDRKMRIEVGYGLEGVLPDARTHRITDEVVKPHFRAGDFAGGIEAGVDALLSAARGEPFAGNGRTAAEAGRSPRSLTVRWAIILLILAALAVLIIRTSLKRRGRAIPPTSPRATFVPVGHIFSTPPSDSSFSSSSTSDSSSSSSDSSSSSSSDFSGGGGDSGGGGSSDSW